MTDIADNDMPRRTILLDSSGVIHRCFHGYPPRWMDYEGQRVDVGALAGYFDYIRRLKDEYPCDRLIHVLDPEQGSSYRFGLYPQYKAGREPSAESLSIQKKLLPIALHALSQSYLQVDGVESDDVLGVLNKKAAADGDAILLVSQDKDLFQLVDDTSTMMVRYVQRNDKLAKVHQHFDEAGVLHEMGVRPDQVADYLAIVGDSSDNIPGVKGAGPAAASKWLREHGSLAMLMTNCDSIKGKIGETLRNSKDEVWLYQKLTTLQCDLEGIEFPDPCQPSPEQYEVFKKGLSGKFGWEADFPAPTPFTPAAPRFR